MDPFYALDRKFEVYVLSIFRFKIYFLESSKLPHNIDEGTCNSEMNVAIILFDVLPQMSKKFCQDSNDTKHKKFS